MLYLPAENTGISSSFYFTMLAYVPFQMYSTHDPTPSSRFFVSFVPLVLWSGTRCSRRYRWRVFK